MLQERLNKLYEKCVYVCLCNKLSSQMKATKVSRYFMIK